MVFIFHKLILLMIYVFSYGHLVVCQSTFKCKMNLFPRLLYWMNVTVGDKVMKTAFDYDMVWTCLTILVMFQICKFLLKSDMCFLV